jgi:hypothetical protein
MRTSDRDRAHPEPHASRQGLYPTQGQFQQRLEGEKKEGEEEEEVKGGEEGKEKAKVGPGSGSAKKPSLLLEIPKSQKKYQRPLHSHKLLGT